MFVNHNGSFAWLPFFLIYDHLYLGRVVFSLFAYIYTQGHQKYIFTKKKKEKKLNTSLKNLRVYTKSS